MGFTLEQYDKKPERRGGFSKSSYFARTELYFEKKKEGGFSVRAMKYTRPAVTPELRKSKDGTYQWVGEARPAARVPPPLPRPQPVPAIEKPKTELAVGPLMPSDHYCATCGGELYALGPGQYRHKAKADHDVASTLYVEKPQDLVTLMLLKNDKDWREDWRVALEKFCYGCKHYVTTQGEIFRCDLQRRTTGTVYGLRPKTTCPEKALVGDDELASWWTPTLKEMKEDAEGGK